jgi:hypothetical protein
MLQIAQTLEQVGIERLDTVSAQIQLDQAAKVLERARFYGLDAPIVQVHDLVRLVVAPEVEHLACEVSVELIDSVQYF